MEYGKEVGDLAKLYQERAGDSEIARKHKGYIRALLGMPNGDEEGLREYLKSPEHARNMHQMRHAR